MSYDDDFSETVAEVYRAMEKARLAGRPKICNARRNSQFQHESVASGLGHKSR